MKRNGQLGWFLALVGFLLALPLPATEKLHGVVVEFVGGWALEDAGIQAGDVLLSWMRLPSPPANPEAAEGVLASYFDWFDLKVEQAPRGTVVLQGQRNGDPVEIRVEPGLWEAEVRPVLLGELEEIYSVGEENLAIGDIGAAVGAWKSLADDLGLGDEGDRDLRAWITLRIGEAWGEQENWEKALESFRVALAAAEKPVARVVIWEALGTAHQQRNEAEATEDAYDSTLEIRKKLHPKSLGVSRSLTYIGELAYARRDFDSARDRFVHALQIREQLAPESLLVAESLNNLGAVSWSRGELDLTYDYFQRALWITEQHSPQSLLVAICQNNLGFVARVRGELGRAYEHHYRALRIREALAPNSRVVASSLNNIGLVAWERGDLDLAHDYLLRSIRLQEGFSPDSLTVAKALNNLGSVAWSRGDLDHAHGYYLQSLKIKETLVPESLTVANSLNNLGSVAVDREDWDSAENYYLQALRIREQLAPESLDVANSKSNLGSVAWKRGDLDLAHVHHFRALQIEEKLAPQSLTVATSLNNLGTIAWSRGDLDRAQDYLRRALRIQEELSPTALGVADGLHNLGDVARDKGELKQAREYYTRALEALEDRLSTLGGSYLSHARFRDQHSDYYHDALDLLHTQGDLGQAFQVLERFRAQTFLTMLAERDTIFAADIPEELDRGRRQLAFDYHRTLKRLVGLNLRDHGDEIKSIRTELRRLQHKSDDIEAQVRLASPRLAGLRDVRALDVVGVQQTLDSGTLLLSYSVGVDHLALFALSRTEDLEVKILPLGEADLRFQVEHLLTLISESSPGSSVSEGRLSLVQAESEALYDALLKPVAERIAASKRLLILPDGPLHALPFAALVHGVDDNGRARYLVEWKPLHVALSATVYAELKGRRHPVDDGTTVQAPIELVAFGDPEYPTFASSESDAVTESESTAIAEGSSVPTDKGESVVTDESTAPRGDAIVRSASERGIFDWPPLPYTRYEVDSVASLFPEGLVRTFLGPEALEERIKSLDPKLGILHLAAHVHTDEHLPMSSFVALTIPENPSPEQDNGLLQVWEIFERVRIDADLVVLSACESGLGQELGSEGLIGLTRAFQYAGARSVVASLWSVADRTTAELMIRFYRHLRSGLPKDGALQAAQIELIRGPIEVTSENAEPVLLDASAPYYWAAFQVFGDWQ